jgi:hypothetical protein
VIFTGDEVPFGRSGAPERYADDAIVQIIRRSREGAAFMDDLLLGLARSFVGSVVSDGPLARRRLREDPHLV